MFPPEYNVDSKAKRLWNIISPCLKPVPGIQIVESVKIKITAVENFTRPSSKK